MVKYELKEKTDRAFVYSYYPEGNMEDEGEVTVDKDGSPISAKVADGDIANMYLGHALSGIKRGNKSGTVAWY